MRLLKKTFLITYLWPSTSRLELVIQNSKSFKSIIIWVKTGSRTRNLSRSKSRKPPKRRRLKMMTTKKLSTLQVVAQIRRQLIRLIKSQKLIDLHCQTETFGLSNQVKTLTVDMASKWPKTLMKLNKSLLIQLQEVEEHVLYRNIFTILYWYIVENLISVHSFFLPRSTATPKFTSMMKAI